MLADLDNSQNMGPNSATSMRTCFIYALCEPGTRTVRYIGKTASPKKRFRAHLWASCKLKSHLGNWLRSLGEAVPNFVLLREVPESEGNSAEINYIRIARESLGMELVNATEGGEGVSGWIPSAETRAKIGAANSGENCSAETRAKKSAAISGKKHPLFGKHLLPETCAKISSSNSGKIRSAETRARISAANLGEKNANFGKHPSPETLARMSVANSGENCSRETREKMSRAQKARREREKTNKNHE